MEKISMRPSPILIIHIAGGVIGLVSGAFAMSFRKGSPGHAAAGNVFVIAMFIMGSCATYLAIMKSQMGNVLGGILTCYLVSSAWMTARRRDGRSGGFDWAALLVPLTVAACLLVFGMQGVYGRRQLMNGEAVAMDFVVASVALLFAAGDIRMIVRGGIFGAHRIARHLLRMSVALFIATGSFFLGQQKVFPVSWRGSPIFFILAFLPLALMIYWLIRVRFPNAYKHVEIPAIS